MFVKFFLSMWRKLFFLSLVVFIKRDSIKYFLSTIISLKTQIKSNQKMFSYINIKFEIRLLVHPVQFRL